MAKWVECRYIDWMGKEVGLTFSYGSDDVCRDIFKRYRLSKENLTMYNVYEKGKCIYSLK